MDAMLRQTVNPPESGDKNINLTLVGWKEDDALPFDFKRMMTFLRRGFALWLCLTIGITFLSSAGWLIYNVCLSGGTARALVSLSEGSARYNILKIKSPAVIESAMNAMDMEILTLNDIRDSIEIKGIIPDSAYEQLSLYYNIITSKSTSSTSGSTVQSLLDTNYQISQYVISLDSHKAGLSDDEGVAFLNALLQSYLDYCAETYDSNLALGNLLNTVDYLEYDYAEAVTLFTNAIDGLLSYLSDLESRAGTNYRSIETGFSFQDLRRTAQTLHDIDLARITSQITMNSVTSIDAATVILHYEWLIENITRKMSVEQARVESLTKSIQEYEKDPILVAVQDGNTAITDADNVNANYDNMIQRKLDAQSRVASYTRNISYYEQLILGLQSKKADSQIQAHVEESLFRLNSKLNSLIKTAFDTVGEYYENAAYANQVEILIPASIQKASILSVQMILSVIFVDAVLFCIFFTMAVFAALKGRNTSKLPESEGDTVHFTQGAMSTSL